jgi:hypothetical protein
VLMVTMVMILIIIICHLFNGFLLKVINRAL